MSCVTALLFSYSCQCRNNSTGPGNGGNVNTETNKLPKAFTSAVDTANSQLLLPVKSDGTTNN